MVSLQKICGAILAFLLPAIAFASVSFQSGEGWPTYTKDGLGYGFTQDSIVYRYYAGQLFIANSSFTATGVQIDTCKQFATSTNLEVVVDVYEVPNNVTSGAYDTSLWTYLNTWGGYAQDCAIDDVQPLTLSGSIYFDVRTINFEQGKKYALVIAPSYYHENAKYSRTSPDTGAISRCGDGLDLFCGGYVIVNATSTYGLWLSFANTAQAQAIYGACITASFPYFDIQQCLSNAFIFLFVPDNQKVNDLKSISFASTTPFSYLYQVSGYLATIRDGVSTSTPKIVIYAPDATVTIFSVASTTPLFGSGAQSIKQFLAWVIWIVAFFVAVFEIYYFIRRTE